MSNQCSFCEDRHVETNMLVLNNGALWVEFCEDCKNETLTNENGEVMTVAAIFKGEKPKPMPETVKEYRSQFGVVTPSDLPQTQRRPRRERKLRINLGKLLKEAGA